MMHLLLSTQTNSPSLTLPRRKSQLKLKNGSNGYAKGGPGADAGVEVEGASDPHPLRNLFRPSLLRNPDLVVGLAWFFQQWSATASAAGRGKGSAAGLRELVGEDEAVYARVKWAIDLVRETLASGAGTGDVENDDDEERERGTGRRWS